MLLKILFLGDIVGSRGREGVKSLLPRLNQKEGLDFVIANGENATHGRGISYGHYQELVLDGVDCITNGNHFYNNKDVFTYASKRIKAVRPGNLDKDAPGVGSRVFQVKGCKIRVSNFLGRAFIPRGQDNPFYAFDERYKNSDKDEIQIVDFHAEATAEKRTFAEYVDGRATAVIGTHTHVQTNDPKYLSKGTFFLTDAGRNGPYDSIIGNQKEGTIFHTVTGRPGLREVRKTGRIQINGVRLEIDSEKKQVVSYRLINERQEG